ALLRRDDAVGLRVKALLDRGELAVVDAEPVALRVGHRELDDARLAREPALQVRARLVAAPEAGLHAGDGLLDGADGHGHRFPPRPRQAFGFGTLPTAIRMPCALRLCVFASWRSWAWESRSPRPEDTKTQSRRKARARRMLSFL